MSLARLSDRYLRCNIAPGVSGAAERTTSAMQRPPEQDDQPEPINPLGQGNAAQPGYTEPPGPHQPGPRGAPEGESLLVPPAQYLRPRGPGSSPQPSQPIQPIQPDAANAAGRQREPSGNVAPLQPDRPYIHHDSLGDTRQALAPDQNQAPLPPHSDAPANMGANMEGNREGNEGMVPPARPIGSQAGAAAAATPIAHPREAHEGGGAERFVTLSSLMRQPIVDLNTGRRVGQVDNIVLSSDHRSVEAYTSHGGFLSGTKAFPARGANIGQDVIALPPGALERFDKRSLRGLPLASSVSGARLLSDTGRVLGTVADMRMDASTAEVLGYEVNPEDRGLLDRLRHRVALLPVGAVRRRGSDAWIVAEEDARRYLGN